MLSKPEFGWSRITIGDWSDRCSYIDDVPFMLLEAMEESCRCNKPVSVKFDAEGWWYLIIFDDFWTYIIEEADETKLYRIEIDRDELAKELIADIRKYIDYWTEWDGYCENADYIEERKKDILILCDVVEKRLR